MLSQDPRMNPETANIIGHDEHQPFAYRSIHTIFGFVVALILLGAFVGWYFFTPSPEEEAAMYQMEVAELAAAERSMPGNEYPEGSGRNALYDFFYTMFGGIEDGLDDSPHNLKNVEQLDDLNLNNVETYVEPTEEEPKTLKEELTERFDGKILDFEGNVAGDVRAVTYKDGELEKFRFALAPSLTPPGEPRHYSVQKDKVKIVEEDGAFFIQLSAEQTRALAEALYDRDRLQAP